MRRKDMVLFSVVAGLIGLIGIGFFSLVAISEVILWSSATVALILGFLTFRFLFNDRPFDVADDEASNNIVYLMISIFAGVVGFKIVNTAFVFYGASMALILSILLVVGYFVGFRNLVSFIAFTAKQLRGVTGGSRR